MTSGSFSQISKAVGWSYQLVCVTAVAYLIIPALTYSLMCLNAPTEIIRQFMNQTELDRTGHPLPQSQVDSFYGLLVAVIGIGAAVGSLTADSISDLIGRKYALYISCITGTIGTLITVLCQVGKSYEMLFIGRTFNGFALGWGLSLAPTYIMEMCLPHQKGAVAMAGIISQSVAMLVSQVCGFQELLGSKEYWLYLIGLPLVLHGLQLILLPFCPHNPRFLLMKRDDEAGAIKALQLIRGHSDVTDEIKQIRAEMADTATESKISVFKLFLTPIMRRPLLVAMVMSLHQSWCGIQAIMLFSGILFRETGVTDRSSRYAISGTGAIFFLSNIIAAFLMPHVGRKTLHVGGHLAIAVLSAVFAVTAMYQESVEFLKYVNIVVALLIVAAFALGPVCVFWVILGEMFPHSARGAGWGVAIFCVFTTFFAQCYVLPVMIESMSSYTFFFYAGIDAAMILFSILYMPETRNKTFEDIAKSWAKPEDLENSEQSPSSMSITNTLPNIQIEFYVNNHVSLGDHQQDHQTEKGSNHINDNKQNDFSTKL